MADYQMTDEDLADVQSSLDAINAARSRDDQKRLADVTAKVQAQVPQLGGAGGGPAPGAPDIGGAMSSFANSPLGKAAGAVGTALEGTAAWMKNLPANVGKGAMDAAVNTGRMLWHGLRQSIEEQFVDEPSRPDAPPATMFKMTPAQLREISDVWANTPHRPHALALDEQAGMAYDEWRHSLNEGDNLSDELTQGIAQFAIPFTAYSKAAGVTAATSRIGMILGAGVTEGATVYSAFDPHGGRLPDLIDLGRQSEGKFGDVLRTLSPDGSAMNTYIEWQTDRTNESDAEGRFKNVVDSLSASAAAAGFIKAAGTTFKAARNAPEVIANRAPMRPGSMKSQRGSLDLSILDSEPRTVPMGNVADAHTGSVLDGEFVVPGSKVLTVSAGDKPAGFIAFKEIENGALQINRTKVDETARGQGLGKKLLLNALEYADKQGKPLISDNTVTVAQLRVYDSLVKSGQIKVKYADAAAVKEALANGDARVPVKGKGGQPVVTSIELVKGE